MKEGLRTKPLPHLCERKLPDLLTAHSTSHDLLYYIFSDNRCGLCKFWFTSRQEVLKPRQTDFMWSHTCLCMNTHLLTQGDDSETSPPKILTTPVRGQNMWNVNLAWPCRLIGHLLTDVKFKPSPGFWFKCLNMWLIHSCTFTLLMKRLKLLNYCLYRPVRLTYAVNLTFYC